MCGQELRGHSQHAETNSFSLYAVDRTWSTPPGYHMSLNDLQTSILVQDPLHRR